MRLAQYFAGIFHNMLPNISRPSLRNIFLHGPSLYNVRRNLYKRPSLRNISLHGPSLYNARPRYLDKRPSN